MGREYDYSRAERLADAGSNPNANPDTLLEMINEHQILTYMAVTALTNNVDGLDNNYYLVRTNQHPESRVMPWELDLSFRSVYRFTPNGFFFKRNALLYFLATSPQMQNRFRQRLIEVAHILNAELLSGATEEIYQLILPAYRHDPVLRQSEPLEAYVSQLNSHFIQQDEVMAPLLVTQ